MADGGFFFTYVSFVDDAAMVMNHHCAKYPNCFFYDLCCVVILRVNKVYVSAVVIVCCEQGGTYEFGDFQRDCWNKIRFLVTPATMPWFRRCARNTASVTRTSPNIWSEL